MEQIQIEAIPNQKLTVRLGNVSYNITINTRRDLTFLSISDFEKPLCYGRLCLPNKKVEIPSYLFSGALFWHCQDDETPHYTQFGVLHKLYYATQEEINEVINGA